MIDQSMRPEAANEGLPPPHHPTDRMISGGIILAIGFLALLAGLIVGLAGLGIILWGLASALAALTPWFK